MGRAGTSMWHGCHDGHDKRKTSFYSYRGPDDDVILVMCDLKPVEVVEGISEVGV